MKLVFFGTPDAAVPSLAALDESSHAVQAVVTRPDKPSGRSRKPAPPPIKRAAIERDLPLFQPTRLLSDEFLLRMRGAAADLFVVVAYGRILKPRLLDTAPMGAINLHFSLLPAFRGAAPVQWALARGAEKTGVTTIQINDRLDEGDLLQQQEVAIEPGEHAPALQRRLAATGASLLVRTVDALAAGTLEAKPQDPSSASLAPILTAEDGLLDLGLRAREIEGRVRGFDPWPGVWSRRAGRRLRIVSARALPEAGRAEPPGTVIEPGPGRLAVVCAGGTLLELLRVQPEGRRPLDAREAINGRQLRPGEILG